MVKIKSRDILLYSVGVALLLFGNRQYWEKFLAEQKKKSDKAAAAVEAQAEFQKEFEVQELRYDSVKNTWKNEYVNFQTISIGTSNVNRPERKYTTTVETNDDEQASDSN
ncbi:hypothetical protein [Sphingobacterium sp. LRF_L2]|uniref:hypothetical protein n=1 Tax=Sphingobacterium sp. LRF_L2 TaxID=3369421 RepID=UPI003F5E0DFA